VFLGAFVSLNIQVRAQDGLDANSDRTHMKKAAIYIKFLSSGIADFSTISSSEGVRGIIHGTQSQT